MPKKSDKPRDPTQTVSLQVRLKEELRAQIEAAATEAGRPMNGEITERLLDSFRDDALFGGSGLKRVMMVAASHIAAIQTITGKSWTEDRTTYFAAAKAVQASLGSLRPQPENYDAVISLMQEQARAFETSGRYRDVLRKYGVLVFRPANALLALTTNRPTAEPELVIEENEDAWSTPEHPDRPFDEEVRAIIRNAIDEYKAIQARLVTVSEELDKLMKPSFETKEAGEAIFNEYWERMTASARVAEEEAHAS